MLKIDSPRISNKLYDIMREVLLSKTLDKFSKEFLDSLNVDEENYNLNVILNENKLYFKGYPSGNLIKIACKILEYWNNLGYFPVAFYKVEGLTVRNTSNKGSNSEYNRIS
jgi:hypothetical protein